MLQLLYLVWVCNLVKYARLQSCLQRSFLILAVVLSGVAAASALALSKITFGHRCTQQGASCALEFLCNVLVQGVLHFQSASLALSARPLAG